MKANSYLQIDLQAIKHNIHHLQEEIGPEKKLIPVLKGNAYMLEQLDGVKFPVAVNGQHLKKYFPSMWDDGQ